MCGDEMRGMALLVGRKMKYDLWRGEEEATVELRFLLRWVRVLLRVFFSFLP